MENLTYLTEGLPARPGFAKLVANRLNDKGIRPAGGGQYTKNIVYNAVYGKQPDDEVKKELAAYRVEVEAKKRAGDAGNAVLDAKIKAALDLIGV